MQSVTTTIYHPNKSKSGLPGTPVLCAICCCCRTALVRRCIP